MSRATLEALEKQFWTGDASFYDSHLARDALMIFAEPVGVLTREGVVDAVASSARWGEVSLEQVRFVELNEHAGILSYNVRARRQEDGAEYSGLVSSVYVQRGGRWWLTFHQQTADEA